MTLEVMILVAGAIFIVLFAFGYMTSHGSWNGLCGAYEPSLLEIIGWKRNLLIAGFFGIMAVIISLFFLGSVITGVILSLLIIASGSFAALGIMMYFNEAEVPA